MASPTAPSPLRRNAIWIVMLTLLVVGQAVWSIAASTHKSTTSDELAHITGGFTFNRYNDYRMQPENGNLPQRLHALPLILSHTTYPSLDQPNWREIDVWLFGYQFFYNSGNDPARLLLAARCMNTLFGIGAAALIALWAWRLYGPLGAVIATGFCTFSPTMLAHSALATSDMAMTCFMLAAVSLYWKHLHDRRLGLLALSSIVFGLACVAKFTAVLLLPMFALLAIARWFNPAPVTIGWRTMSPSQGGRASGIALSLALHGLVATFIIWAFFGFRFSALNPALPSGVFYPTFADMIGGMGWKGEIIAQIHAWRLLPEGFLHGLSHALQHAESRGAFLDGDYGTTGWVSFFPRAFLYKTPPSFLIASLLSLLLLGLAARAQPAKLTGRRLYVVLPLLVIFTIYWAASLASHLNIGHRHILPTYPILFILTGTLGWALQRAWRHSRANGLVVATLVGGLLAGQITAAVGISPHFLAYFSPVVGGPSQGYRHLVDSSLDWGQDLPGLHDWLAKNQHPDETVYLSYFGNGEPTAYGIDAVMMPRLNGFARVRPWYWPQPGIYAISASMFQQVYMPDRGPWTAELETRYQMLRHSEPAFLALKTDPYGHPELLTNTTYAEWGRAWALYDNLRFARLCTFLRMREPDAMVGYSILIFRLDQTELDAALAGSVNDLLVQPATAETQP